MAVKIVETALRDGHQCLFATRMTTKEILSVITELDSAGYYALEVWGGATFDACLRFLDEDPWERLRQIKAKCSKTKLQMLFRGQSILGYKHYPDDVVYKFVQKAIENGIDIIRVFDALNDIRNLESSVKAIKKYGGHCQIALSYTVSPVHTFDYYVDLAIKAEKMGADSLCLKDMAGILLPNEAFELITRIKANTSLELNLHSHSTAGIMQATYLKAIEAGVDIIDTSLSPFSGGTSQPATESFQYILSGTKYDPNLNVEMLEQAAVKLTVVKDVYLKNGYLNPKVLTANPGILKYQVPGGMISNLISQLKDQKSMHLYEKVLREIPIVRKEMGYPPLVTPLSQMIGTQALINVMTGNRYKTVPKEIKEYLKGLYGQSPVKASQDIKEFIIGNSTVISHRPADDLDPKLPSLRVKYKDLAQNDEDILSLALFETIAVEFLEKKYTQKHKVEVEAFMINFREGE